MEEFNRAANGILNKLWKDFVGNQNMNSGKNWFYYVDSEYLIDWLKSCVPI
jgi:hypothetical protein